MLRLFKRKPKQVALTKQTILPTTGAQAVWTPRDYAHLAKEGYTETAWVYAVIDALTRAAAPTRFYTVVNGKEVAGHPLTKLLTRPNPSMGGSTFFSNLYGYYLLSGNAYVELVGGNTPSSADELWLKRPDRMRVIPGARDTLVAGYDYTVDSKTIRIPASKVRHLKSWHPLSDWYGMAPIEAAARGVDLFNEGQAHNLALMQNGARPTGAWVSQSGLNDKEYARLRKELDELSLPSKRGGSLLLEGDVTWQNLGVTPKDLDWLRGQSDAARQIHAVYGVHPVLTGLDTGTYENQRQAMRSLLISSVLPFIDVLTSELNEWLAPRYPGAVILYDKDAYPALGDDQESLWRRAERGFARGFITLNEARDLVGYAPLPGGDRLVENPQALPSTQLGADSAPQKGA